MLALMELQFLTGKAGPRIACLLREALYRPYLASATRLMMIIMMMAFLTEQAIARMRQFARNLLILIGANAKRTEPRQELF